MNKQALKLKKKRKALREQEIQNKINKIWDEFKDVTNNPNLKQDKELMLKLYKTVKQVDNDSMIKSGVISLVISLIVLKDFYNFTKSELINYSVRLQKFIYHFTSEHKSVNDFIYELEHDYNVDITNRFNEFPKLTLDSIRGIDNDELIIKTTIDNIKYFLAISAYSFMNYLSYSKGKVWNSDDLENFISKFIILYKNILDDVSKLSEYNKNLYDFGLYINLDNGNLKEL